MPRAAPSEQKPKATRRGSVDFGEFRETNATVRRPPMGAFDPKYRMTEAIHQGARAIERADHDLVRLAPSRGSVLQRLRREALARNAFATATIEGNPLTMPEVESLLRAGPSPASANSKDELEILNYVELMGTPEAKKAPRTPADVLRVHAALFHRVLKDAGAWKSKPNFIGKRPEMSVVYLPTPPERVERELAAAIDWLHDARDHPPLLRALLFHHEFESIHPFRDGNGRTGRAITPMALHELGYGGCAYAQIDHRIYRRRAEYYESLAIVERARFQDHTPWLEFMVSVVAQAYGAAVDLAHFERALPDDLPERQRRVADWFAALHQESPQARAKFNDVHQAFPEVPARTLKRDLAELRDAAILQAEGTLKGTTYRLKRR